MTRYALVTDVGGTHIRVALVDDSGRLTNRHSSLTLASRGRDDLLGRLLNALESVAAKAPPDSLVGVGLAVAGPTDPETGIMFSPPNIPDWDGFSPVSAVEERLSLKVRIANDASLAALAEHAYGAGRGSRDMIYLTLSTGIGGGIVVGGRLYSGNRGFAGEMGHITIDPDGPRCNCGNFGCLEAMASGTAVARMARERLTMGDRSILSDKLGPAEEADDARKVAEAAASEDRLARDIMGQVARNLGIGIASLANAFAPEVIVLGGGMSGSFEMLILGIAEEMDRRLMGPQRGLVRVVKSELGADAGLFGAAALVFDSTP